jgi:hypothetical protein
MAYDQGNPIAGALPGLLGGAAGGPLGLALEGVGAIGGIASAIGGMSAQKGEYQAQQNIAALEQQQNTNKFQQTTLNFNRSRLQELRNAQQGRSVALANASGSGAQFGSALGGGLGNVGGEEGNTMVNLSQNQQIAQQEYNVDTSISAQKMAEASYGSQAATWAGIGNLFGGAGNLGKGIVSANTNPSGSTQTTQSG